MLFFRNKEAVDVDKNQIPEEEVTEKPTTKVGYFLLFIMGVLVFWFGEWIIFDVSTIVEKPVPPTNCFSFSTYDKDLNYPSQYNEYYYGTKHELLYDNYYYYENYTPTYSDIDKLFGIDDACTEIGSLQKERSKYQRQLNELNNQISDITYQLEVKRQEYDLSLQERQANYNQNYNSGILYTDITNLKNLLANLNQQRADVESSIAKIQSNVTVLSDGYKDEYKAAVSQYTKSYYWYLILVFLARLVVIGPLFFIAVRIYTRLKKRNSAHSIIAGAVLIPLAILFAQITIGWIWGMVPRSWIDALIELFSQLAIFRYVIYYGSILLVIAIIGGIVYFIQKRVFSPERTAIRRLKDYKCPQCEFPIKGHDFCPKCGSKITEPCTHCGGKRFVRMPHCPACGVKK